VLDIVAAGRVEDESRVSGQLPQLLDPPVTRTPHLFPLFRGCAGRLNSLPGSDHDERTITERCRFCLPKLRGPAGTIAERSIELPDRYPAINLCIKDEIIFICWIDE
jgi:hypothetical protein